MIYNSSLVIRDLPITVGEVVRNARTADPLEGTSAPFSTWTGDIKDLIVKTTTATDNSVTKGVGINANGETKLYDIVTENIIELGTITYTDINSAPLAQDIFIALTTNNFPDSSYTTGIIYKINEPFDGSDNFSISDGSHNVLYELSESPVLTNYIGEYSAPIVIATSGIGLPNEQYKQGSFVAELALKFITANPQDLTAGSVTIYAITKPFPFW